MHWIPAAIGLLFVLLGWYGVYDAAVHGNPTSNTMSFAGALLGLAMMIAGCGLLILSRMIQAGSHHCQILSALDRSTPSTVQEPGPIEPKEDRSRSVLASEVPRYEGMGWRLVSRQGDIARMERP